MKSNSFFVSFFSNSRFETIITGNSSGKNHGTDTIFFLCHKKLSLQNLDDCHLEFISDFMFVIFGQFSFFHFSSIYFSFYRTFDSRKRKIKTLFFEHNYWKNSFQCTSIFCTIFRDNWSTWISESHHLCYFIKSFARSIISSLTNSFKIK